MKRRNFGLLAGTSLMALKMARAKAQTASNPDILKTKLTPFGAERAGNADGSIPAWTGGLTSVPDGWQPGQYMPDPYASDAVLVKIDATNMGQYTEYLNVGTAAMMTKYPDFYINVYPTHRSAAAPQDVYDNTAANTIRAQLDSAGPELGFTGGAGGLPFPILDASDPLAAGAQCIWNCYCLWRGRAFQCRNYCIIVTAGGEPYISGLAQLNYDFPFYHKGVTPSSFEDVVLRSWEDSVGPPNDVGEEYLTYIFTDPLTSQNEVWELLNGQGRVRKAPEVSYDAPASAVDGLANTDEYFGFSGAPDRYNWNYKGKKELFVPYHNNKLVGLPPMEALSPSFANPEHVRWEKHRVHIVEATVRPDRRNTLPRRTFYFDEDTYVVSASEAYDSNNNLLRVGFVYTIVRPDLPGTFIINNSANNMQTGDYTMMSGPFDEIAHPSIRFSDSLPNSMFDPQSMAASAQY